MPDYDIEVTGLATPPVAAPVAAYRPAVSVRNNGIHPADVSGTMRVYRREPPGELLGTFTLSLANLAAGATGTAQSSTFWTPAVGDIGREFLFTADVTTDNDQVEPNNHLGPTTVLIIPGEEPTPPAVIPHAPQHEDGGSDEINIAGLPGQAADPQVPTDHESTHRAGAPDELNVANLHGVLYDDQRAQDHGNERHTPDMASSAELDAHALGTTAHADATNLANREVSGDEEGLVKGDQLVLGSEAFGADTSRFLARDRLWRKPPVLSVNSPAGSLIITPADGEVTITSLPLNGLWQNPSLQATLEAFGLLQTSPASGSVLRLSLYVKQALVNGVEVPCDTSALRYLYLKSTFDGHSNLQGSGMVLAVLTNPVPSATETYFEPSGAETSFADVDAEVSIKAQFINSNPDSELLITSARAINSGPLT